MGTIDAAIPAALADVALIDVKACAAARGCSTSTFLQLVQDGRAPQPAIRGQRATRWRLADIRQWLIGEAQRGGDAAAVEAMQARNRRHLTSAREAKKRTAQTTAEAV